MIRQMTTATPSPATRAATATDPLAGAEKPRFYRYQVRLPGTGETFEYVDSHFGAALLPAWEGFETHFIPSPAEATRRKEGAPETCVLLGHVLSLHGIERDHPLAVWPDVKRLELEREVLVGTGRNFKDVEGRRLPQSPQPRNYTYTNFTAADYRTMIEAGMNLFTIEPDQEQWVRAEPVFYLRRPQGQPPLLYPADLYRAKYLGPAMFIDEPASILTWDKYATAVLTHFSDATADPSDHSARVTPAKAARLARTETLRRRPASRGIRGRDFHRHQPSHRLEVAHGPSCNATYFMDRGSVA